MNQCWPPNQFKPLGQHFLQLWHSLAFISPMKGLYASLYTLLCVGLLLEPSSKKHIHLKEAEIQGAGSMWTMPPLVAYGTLKMPQEKLDTAKDYWY